MLDFSRDMDIFSRFSEDLISLFSPPDFFEKTKK